jgi:hypothetical protein
MSITGKSLYSEKTEYELSPESELSDPEEPEDPVDPDPELLEALEARETREGPVLNE